MQELEVRLSEAKGAGDEVPWHKVMLATRPAVVAMELHSFLQVVFRSTVLTTRFALSLRAPYSLMLSVSERARLLKRLLNI